MEQGYDVRHTWYINNLQKENNKTDFTDTFFLEKKNLLPSYSQKHK